MFKIFKKKKKTNIIINGFDEEKYLEANPDVREAIRKGQFKSAKDHLEKFGLNEIKEGKRKFHPDFELYNEEKYLEANPDVKEAVDKGEFNSGFEHFCKYGYKDILEKRRNLKNNQELNLKEIKEVIKNSNLFDEEYYLKEYPDVKAAKISPLEHYLLYGWKEGRNPSKNFDTKYYLKVNNDVARININPLYHYILYGQKEGRVCKNPISDFIMLDKVLFFFNDEKYIPNLDINRPIDILIPVYNGYDFLEPLLNSIKENTFLPYRLLICDDKSTDERVFPFLENFVKKNLDLNVVLLQNEENKGFVYTVNKLVKYVNNHFVILNTDTEVPPFWLERLMAPIITNEKIATTTPFTNAGTICSFPKYLEDNEIYENLSVEKLDKYFQYVNNKYFIEIPTGVGFCMGVNKNLVEKIGMFDEIFGKGYGEENDFCQRAIENGYKNIHIPNLFVYHKHGGSFLSEEKQKLIKNNLNILKKRYPNYEKDIQVTIKKDEYKNLREFLQIKILTDQYDSILFFDHDLGGGANYYLDEKIKKLRLNDKKIITIIKYDYKNEKGYFIKILKGDLENKYYAKNFDELKKFLNFLHFDEIFLNSLVSYNNIYDILDYILVLKKHNKAKLIIPIHDYFPICPNYTLLNEKNEYCNLPNNYKECLNCLIKNKGEFKSFTSTVDIEKWRENWKMLLEHADEVLCFSNSSKNIVKKAYNEKLKFNVVPHDINGKYKNIYNEKLKNKKEKVIGVLGGINIPKGALIVKDLVKYIEKNNINAKVILIGDISEDINSPVFYKTGRYKPEELPELVKKLGITEFFIPSIWPETYSYTTDEVMQLGYPLTVFDIGAPAERVKKYEKGKVIKNNNIESLFENK